MYVDMNHVWSAANDGEDWHLRFAVVEDGKARVAQCGDALMGIFPDGPQEVKKNRAIKVQHWGISKLRVDQPVSAGTPLALDSFNKVVQMKYTPYKSPGAISLGSSWHAGDVIMVLIERTGYVEAVD